MKGRTPTVKEKKHMSDVAELGCIVCRINGFPNSPAEIHHVDGRTKPDAHYKILPLCYYHHRAGGDVEPISRHPYKTRFEDAYGTEKHLMTEVNSLMRLNKLQ
jgi:hypothetical protein|tara:strand:+ start:498 stop:806 length:309 start_codon:yes stop_codon:yes gene_type:complete